MGKLRPRITLLTLFIGFLGVSIVLGFYIDYEYMRPKRTLQRFSGEFPPGAKDLVVTALLNDRQFLEDSYLFSTQIPVDVWWHSVGPGQPDNNIVLVLHFSAEGDWYLRHFIFYKMELKKHSSGIYFVSKVDHRFGVGYPLKWKDGQNFEKR